MATILIIDDDPGILDTLSLMVERMGHQPLTASRLAQGIAAARGNEVDVVFLDVRMPDGSGLDALPDLERAPSSPE
ncbi:response regulator, partial [Geoalkalibacter sp.]|uniref:response regulator n=1 Tax=Geoalkalibacter sp. TaxID=3041440 RepID=UPI00272DD4F5